MESFFGNRVTHVCILLVLATACVWEYRTNWFVSNILSCKGNNDAYADTTCGKVVGNKTVDGYVFAGIPFALPPTGSLRWKHPVRLDPTKGTCWNGTFNAKKFGSICNQRDVFQTDVHLGDEDCLFINVWTPTANTDANLPVMVWLHGGFLTLASGSWPGYSPTSTVANETQMVFISMNYRLAAFGFLALDLLSSDSKTGTSGNYAIMDIIAALEWVKDNVKNFGGNPNSVTIYGQSSGGTALLALLVSPMAEGLFHRAWMISASPILNKTLQDATTDNMVFQRKTGCKTLACLYELTADQILDASPWDEYPFWGAEGGLDIPTKGHFLGPLLIVDGVVIPEAPLDAWKAGRGIDVPLVIGTTAQEVDMFPARLDVNTWTWDDYTAYVTERLKPFGQQVLDGALKYYPAWTMTPEFQFTSMASDIRVSCINDELGIHAAKRFTNPVYRYVVDYYPSAPTFPWGFPFPSRYAYHLLDYYAYMGEMGDYIAHPTTIDLAFQKLVRDEMDHFCKTGKVKSSSWKPFSQSTSTAIISERLYAKKDRYHKTECEFFDKHGLLSYSWIN